MKAKAILIAVPHRIRSYSGIEPGLLPAWGVEKTEPSLPPTAASAVLMTLSTNANTETPMLARGNFISVTPWSLVTHSSPCLSLAVTPFGGSRTQLRQRNICLARARPTAISSTRCSLFLSLFRILYPTRRIGSLLGEAWKMYGPVREGFKLGLCVAISCNISSQIVTARYLTKRIHFDNFF